MCAGCPERQGGAGLTTVLITGGRGFLGRNLAAHLTERKDCEITIFRSRGLGRRPEERVARGRCHLPSGRRQPATRFQRVRERECGSDRADMPASAGSWTFSENRLQFLHPGRNWTIPTERARRRPRTRCDSLPRIPGHASGSTA